jgi:hypothetical protein
MILDPANTVGKNVHETDTERWNALRKEPTVSLIRRIVEDSDVLAIKVFHDTRTIFFYRGKWLRFVEFLNALKMKWEGILNREESHMKVHEVLDSTYDLTCAKFQNFPVQHRRKNGPRDDESGDSRGFAENVDCRNHFRAFLKEMNKRRRDGKFKSEADEEEEAGKLLKGLVVWHFGRSLKDSLRHSPHSTRYELKIKGKKLYLSYPSHMKPKEFRDWLAQNAMPINPDAPMEKDRIQELIKERLGYGQNIPLDDTSIGNKLGADYDHLPERKEGERFSDGLAASVAKEKSENLDKLRPAIRNLGKENVFNLVTRIFSDIRDGSYELSSLAREYGLSKAALSRFAGSEWFKGLEHKSKEAIPDLWTNTASLLANHPPFMEAVENAGYAGKLETVLNIIDPKRGQEDD